MAMELERTEQREDILWRVAATLFNGIRLKIKYGRINEKEDSKMMFRISLAQLGELGCHTLKWDWERIVLR